LEGIWEYIAPDDPLAADNFIAALLDVIEQLAAMPRMGRPRRIFGENIRSHPHGDYVIYYQADEGSRIKVLRIIHGARDVHNLGES
jgi:toxin ParE1/3/4